MISSRYPFDMMGHDMEDMWADPESLFHAVSSGNRLLPPGGMSDRMLPSTGANSAWMSENMMKM